MNIQTPDSPSIVSRRSKPPTCGLGFQQLAMVGASRVRIVCETLCEATISAAIDACSMLAAGGTAIRYSAAAYRFAEVTFHRLSGRTSRAGSRRAKADRLPVTFPQANTKFSLRTRTFNVVLSTFGMMFTPGRDHPREQARARLPSRRGGSASPNWTPRASSASCSGSSAGTCHHFPHEVDQLFRGQGLYRGLGRLRGGQCGG